MLLCVPQGHAQGLPDQALLALLAIQPAPEHKGMLIIGAAQGQVASAMGSRLLWQRGRYGDRESLAPPAPVASLY